MASIEYVVNATDAASGVFAKIALSADGLDKQLEDLSKRVATPEIDLKDAKFTQGMIRAAQRLDKLSAKVADPKIEVDGSKAQLEILRISAMLDRLDAKRVSVDVAVHRSLLSQLGGLFGGGGGGGIGGLGLAAAGAAGRGGGGGGFLAGAGQFVASPGGAAVSGLAAFPGAALIDFLIGGGLSAGVAGAGALGVQHFDPKVLVPGLNSIKDVLSNVFHSIGPSLGMAFAAFGKSIQGLGPQLSALFSASLPFMKTFLTLLTQTARVMLPAFTQALKAFQPALPAMSQGLLILAQGFAGLITAIGPGMKAGALVFRATMIGIRDILFAVGGTFGWLGDVAGREFHYLRAEFDRWRHDVAVIFDGSRHDIAAIWDAIWNNTVTRIGRGVQDVLNLDARLRHDIASEFDTIRHDIASAWDAIWNGTVARVQRGVQDVNNWFHRLPGMILGSLRGLGHSLGSFASAALTEMWDGFKRIGGGIVGWVQHFAGDIVGVFKKVWGIFSPSSVFRSLGENLMHGLAQGIRGKAHLAQNAMSAVSGSVGSGVQRWAPLVTQALRMEGLSPGLLHNVLYQMQTESGGNPNAINLTDINAQMGDPSRGLMQVIGSTFGAYHWPGTSSNIYNPLANIAAALNYARHVYGPSLMSGGMGIGSGHGYDSGGWLPTGLSLAANFTGRPERVLGPGEAYGGNTYNISINVPVSASKADVGRQVVETIKEFERRSGAGWRS